MLLPICLLILHSIQITHSSDTQNDYDRRLQNLEKIVLDQRIQISTLGKHTKEQDGELDELKSQNRYLKNKLAVFQNQNEQKLDAFKQTMLQHNVTSSCKYTDSQ